MTYDDVLRIVTASPGQSFTGIHLREDGSYLGIYTVSTDVDAPTWVGIHFDGGPLFANYGETETYSFSDAPEVVEKLSYQPTASFPVLDVQSEHALYRLFPQLPDPEDLWTHAERNRFRALAVVAARASGAVTITAGDSSSSRVDLSYAWPARHRVIGGRSRRDGSVPFGLKEGILLRAVDVENGQKCGCVCPECGDALSAANRGKIQIPHFRHVSRPCLRGYEVGVLRAAKETLARNAGLLLPAFSATVSGTDMLARPLADTVSFPAQILIAEQLDIDPGRRRGRPDVILRVRERELHVKLRVSYAETKGARRKIYKSGPSVLEIDLSDMELETINSAERFAQAVLSQPDNRQWLRHQKGMRLIEEKGYALAAKIKEVDRIIKDAQESLRQAIARQPQQRAAKAPFQAFAKPCVPSQPGNRIEQKLYRGKLLIENYQEALERWDGKGLLCGSCQFVSNPNHRGNCSYCGGRAEKMLLIDVSLARITAISMDSDLTVPKSLANAPHVNAQEDTNPPRR
jgi:hypothetical protein